MSVNETTNSATVEPVAEAVSEIAEPMISAGTQLAALREARGWTTVQIANQLNLANRQIQALEADNYEALPGMVIVRGFIRAYAKVLQTDPAPILAAVIGDTAVPPVLQPERNTLSASFSETRLSPSGSRGLSSKTVMGVVAVVVIGVLLFAGQRMGWLPEGVSAVSSNAEEKSIPAESAEAAVEVPETETIEATSGANEPVQPVVPEAVKPQPVTPAPAVATVKPVTAPPAPAPALAPTPTPTPVSAAAPAGLPVAAPQASKVTVPAIAVSVNSKDALAIKVREDSWVEIKRADNSIVLSRLLKAGSSEVVEVSGPVSMVIGNAAGVDVTLRGTPIDIVAGNTSNVARLNLK
ncbi:helix-turn-helix domain-containing protein [Herminiimonas sp. NPDC097707]|uniref:helix-turn-helix domain-containing protein n=1 Tax=Herminiimonas sp. NPDC097707 TaxID=3364007 RepID=UPI00383B778B